MRHDFKRRLRPSTLRDEAAAQFSAAQPTARQAPPPAALEPTGADEQAAGLALGLDGSDVTG